MNDYFGSRLEKGDIVAVSITHYAHLREGIVAGFTPKRVRLLMKPDQFMENGAATVPPERLIKKPAKGR